MLDRCWNTARASLDCVNCVSNTDGVRRQRYTQLNSKSFSAAVSHTCEDEDDFVDKTIWVDLTNCHVFSVKCDCESSFLYLFESQSARSLFSGSRPYCPPFCAGCCFF